MSDIEIEPPTIDVEQKPKKKKYIRSQEQIERNRAYNRKRYTETKQQLKYYHAKPIEERDLYYLKNKDVIIERARLWQKNKREVCKAQEEEIKLLRSYLTQAGVIPPEE
tara:strand:+ start:310 stop:636 length:327 start_codon:yes stop_codon:yes gene_type:complete